MEIYMVAFAVDHVTDPWYVELGIQTVGDRKGEKRQG